MHLHPHHSPMLYMKPQKDNSTRLRASCAATFYSRQGVCVSLSTPTCSREWWLNACKAFELHVPHQYQKEGAGAHLHPWRFPGSKDERTDCSVPQVFDELFPPLESRTHGSSLSCCHQMFVLQKCRLSFLSWALFPPPCPCRAPGSRGCSCPLTSCASASKPNTSTTGRRNTTTTSTDKHKELGIVLPGKHSPVLQTSAWCDLQKQKLTYTCTR